MKKNICNLFWIFAFNGISQAGAPQDVKNFISNWNGCIHNSNVQRVKAWDPSAPAYAGQEDMKCDLSEKEKALYKAIANFNKVRYNEYREGIKNSVLALCKAWSPTSVPPETLTQIATAFVNSNAETLCKAAPLIGKDTCEDILGTAFPLTPKKQDFLLDKLKFWKK